MSIYADWQYTPRLAAEIERKLETEKMQHDDPNLTRRDGLSRMKPLPPHMIPSTTGTPIRIDVPFNRPENPDMKNPFKSKTLIVNGLTLAAGLIYVVVEQGENVGIPAKHVAIAGSIYAAINMVLRFVTSQPIGAPAPAAE